LGTIKNTIKIGASSFNKRSNIMTKNQIIKYLQENQQYFYDNYGIKFIGLFGSFARNEASQTSDIVILYKIEPDKKLSIFKYLQINQQLEEYFKRKVDLVRDETLKEAIKPYIQKDLSYV
jgi:predicted nucleotidyltransferase